MQVHVQPNPDLSERLLDRLHLGHATCGLDHVQQGIGEDVDLSSTLDGGFESGQQPNALHCGSDHPWANDGVATPPSR